MQQKKEIPIIWIILATIVWHQYFCPLASSISITGLLLSGLRP